MLCSPREVTKLLPLKVDPNEKGDKSKTGIVASHESVPIHLSPMFYLFISG